MPPQQLPGGHNTPYSTLPTKSHSSRLLIPLILVTLLFVGSIGFAVWAFMGRQDYKDNVEPKIQTAVAVAIQQEASRKDNEFLEREKSPLKTYNGPDTFGTIKLKYPKTWSGYVVEKTQTTNPIDGYFHPGYVPDIQGKTAFALRIQVVNHAYDQELKAFDGKAKSGTVKISAYKAKNVNVTGARITGEVTTGEESTMVLLPLRDKTLKVWTESTRFTKDFDSIILANLTFIP